MSRHDRGAALVTALFILLAVMVIGVSAAQTALTAEKAGRAERDRQIALQAAEAALLDAERDIDGDADPASERAALFAAGNAIGFVEGCERDPRNANVGLCAQAPADQAGAWQVADLAVDAVEYGRFTKAVLPTAAGPLPARLPAYLIESMPLVRAGEDAEHRAGNFYRITAIGFGTRASTTVVLQAFYRKVAIEQGGAP